MISSAMALRLCDMYQMADLGKKVSRKTILVMVDSIIEQLCDYYFNCKPNGILNLRAKINMSINEFPNEEDIVLLKSFERALRSYDSAFSKNYVDNSDTLDSFLNNELNDLLVKMTHHSFLVGNREVENLRGFLR